MYLLDYKSRAFVNYIIGLVLICSSEFHFLTEPTHTLNQLLGFALIAIALVTDYRYSFLKVIPMKISNKIELILSVIFILYFCFFISAIGIFDIAFYISLGVVLLIINIVTNFKNLK